MPEDFTSSEIRLIKSLLRVKTDIEIAKIIGKPVQAIENKVYELTGNEHRKNELPKYVPEELQYKEQQKEKIKPELINEQKIEKRKEQENRRLYRQQEKERIKYEKQQKRDRITQIVNQQKEDRRKEREYKRLHLQLEKEKSKEEKEKRKNELLLYKQKELQKRQERKLNKQHRYEKKEGFVPSNLRKREPVRYATRVINLNEQVAIRVNNKTIIYVRPGANVEEIMRKYSRSS